MINTQPFIDKLDLLREYMYWKIDNWGVDAFTINLSALPTITPEAMMKMWLQTGVLMCYGEPAQPSVRILNFDEWLKYKQQC
jgi:hypothetical protein